ncbi:uncharacterized protein LOC120784364 isoform X2 [Xiphias gladius]|nr:uncharacterized protein LOC120784364 isoform X2 [Xiphias gladius]
MGQTVNYSGAVCAVKNSTVTLPCTFKPFESLIEDGRQVFPQVIRVRWCKNHEICQGTTPSVYNSDSKYNDPRYRYLGDMKGNCTLQIRNVKMADNATLRFRMELNYSTGHFTGRSGVVVRVVEGTQMRIKGSSDGGMMREGETVTLRCTSACTFHQLEVTWSRNDRDLQEFGSALQLGPLTAEDSGNYTCGLKKNPRTRSLPYMLHVQPVETVNKGIKVDNLRIVQLVLFTVHTVCIIIVAYSVIKRTCV